MLPLAWHGLGLGSPSHLLADHCNELARHHRGLLRVDEVAQAGLTVSV